MKIPGLAHEVNVRLEEGVHQVALSLRGDIIATTPIRSRSEAGIMKALVEVSQKAEIAHQIPESIFSDLANRLTSESGYLEADAEVEAGVAGGMAIYPGEIEEKLDLILEKLNEIASRLEKLENKE
ncbi:MAG: hypothetical protein ACXAC7_07810 [Candidatus Hodarchaeales archaeon]